MLWDFPFPSAAQAVKESLFLEEERRLCVHGEGAMPATWSRVCRAGCGRRHPSGSDGTLTDSISQKPQAGPHPISSGPGVGRRGTGFPQGYMGVPGRGHCVTTSLCLKCCLKSTREHAGLT